jgi:hypothetical protein
MPGRMPLIAILRPFTDGPARRSGRDVRVATAVWRGKRMRFRSDLSGWVDPSAGLPPAVPPAAASGAPG